MKSNVLFVGPLALAALLVCCTERTDRPYVDGGRNFAPPPAVGRIEHCDSLKARTRAVLKQGTIELVTDQFPHGDIDDRILFEKLLRNKFGMKLLPVFDSLFYPDCVAPLMDSMIVEIYGPQGKDSIIKLLNGVVKKKRESAY